MPREQDKYISMKAVQGFGLVSKNGTSGVLEDILFRDRLGSIRHIVFDMSRWLPRNYLLLDPEDLGPVDTEEQAFPVLMADSELRERPQIHSDPPVSRQQESLTGMDEGKGLWSYLVQQRHKGETSVDAGDEAFDPHLRSAREIIGYDVTARDGDAGQVTDVLFDQTGWTVRYFAVENGPMLEKREVLLGIDEIDAISWEAKSVQTSLLRDRIFDLPVFDRDGQTESPPSRDVFDQFSQIFGEAGDGKT